MPADRRGVAMDILTLPSGSALTEAERDRVFEALTEFLDGRLDTT